MISWPATVTCFACGHTATTTVSMRDWYGKPTVQLVEGWMTVWVDHDTSHKIDIVCPDCRPKFKVYMRAM